MSLRRRLAVWRTAAAVLGAALAAVVAFVPLPYLELSPGPTYNTIGEVGGKPLIEISGTPTFPTSGHLDLTTVSERGGPDYGVLAVRLLTGWADSDVRVLPREAFYPDQVQGSEVDQQNAVLFTDSTSTAIAAAMHHLGRPVHEVVTVFSVVVGSPADGELQPGDQIVSIDGHAVSAVADVSGAMDGVQPGDTVNVVVRRGPDHVRQSVSIVTEPSPTDPTRAFMGIEAGTTYEADFDITVTLDGVGGPSAGLMMSLGIVDLLTPGALVDGRYVAGTGTIDPDGKVGAIGGIPQKLAGARSAGATLFLAPAANCAEAVAAGIPSGLTVARVETLDDAVAAIEAYRAGRPVTPCTS